MSEFGKPQAGTRTYTPTIVRACNDEVEKRRALEAQLKNMQAGGPMIVCAEKSVTLSGTRRLSAGGRRVSSKSEE